jgi:hypothetical protein
VVIAGLARLATTVVVARSTLAAKATCCGHGPASVALGAIRVECAGWGTRGRAGILHANIGRLTLLFVRRGTAYALFGGGVAHPKLRTARRAIRVTGTTYRWRTGAVHCAAGPRRNTVAILRTLLPAWARLVARRRSTCDASFFRGVAHRRTRVAVAAVGVILAVDTEANVTASWVNATTNVDRRSIVGAAGRQSNREDKRSGHGKEKTKVHNV